MKPKDEVFENEHLFTENDKYYVKKLVDLLEKELDKMPKEDFSRRVFSPRMHGFFNAKFIVHKNLPDELCVGMFQKGAEYSAKLRYSSAFRKNQIRKSKKDVRSLAIKVFVKDQNQDFLFGSSPFFRSRNLKQTYIGLWFLFHGTLTTIIGVLKWPYIAYKALISEKLANDLFNLSYYSQTAFTFGQMNKLVKYIVAPRELADELNYDLNFPDFLSRVFVKRMNDLEEGEHIELSFSLQFQTHEDTHPEDPVIVWKGIPVEVATILIPKQDFNNAYEEGQNMCFNVSNTLKEHNYFGAMNWGRHIIYEKLQQYRNKLDQENK